jgi:hypothetical protein
MSEKPSGPPPDEQAGKSAAAKPPPARPTPACDWSSPESLRIGAEEKHGRRARPDTTGRPRDLPAHLAGAEPVWVNANDSASLDVQLVYGSARPLKIVRCDELVQLVTDPASRGRLWRTMTLRALPRRLFGEVLGRPGPDVFCEGCFRGAASRAGGVACRSAVEPPAPLAPHGQDEPFDVREQEWFSSAANWLILCADCSAVRERPGGSFPADPWLLGWRIGQANPERVTCVWRGTRSLLARDGSVLPLPAPGPPRLAAATNNHRKPTTPRKGAKR